MRSYDFMRATASYKAPSYFTSPYKAWRGYFLVFLN